MAEEKKSPINVKESTNDWKPPSFMNDALNDDGISFLAEKKRHIGKDTATQNDMEYAASSINGDMTLDEIVEFVDDEDNFKQHLSELNVPKASIIKILSKIQKTKKPKPNNNNNNNNNTQKTVVVISEKEHDAMESLNKRDVNITALIKHLTERDDKISQNQQAVEATINEEYDNLIKLINESRESALKKLREIGKEKKLEISAKSQQLETQQNNAQNGIKTCHELVHNIDIARDERQNKILSTVDGVIKEEIVENVNDISTDIVLTFNKENVSSFIAGLVDVDNEERYPIPAIDNIQCEGITVNQCKVRWKAALSQQDLEKKVTSKLFMKITNMNMEMDEKEREEMSSDLISFDRNNTNYQHEMNKLKKDTVYKMNIAMYERKEKDNDAEERENVKESSFYFKTLAIDFDEKQFKYQSHFDTNGICYFLGTNFGKTSWSNPANRGLIKVDWIGKGCGEPYQLVDRGGGNVYTTDDKSNSWISFDFGARLKIKPTAYSVRHNNNKTNEWYQRYWNFEGSNDGYTWRVIKNHSNDESINKIDQSYTWNVGDCNEGYYRRFRLKMTSHNSKGDWCLMTSRFEIYGFLTGNIQ